MKELAEVTDTAIDQVDVLADCADAYALAKRFEARSDKSVHWNVFPADFARCFAFRDAWPNLLRNGITSGFNDDTMTIADRWARRQHHDYGDLVPRNDGDQDYTSMVTSLFRFCAGRFGLRFVEAVQNNHVGSPRLAEFAASVSNSEGQKERRFAGNFHDLTLVYFCGLIFRTMRSSTTALQRFQERPTFVEIGGGFGELSAKMKMVEPKLRSVIFDLPEPGAVQHYFLRHRYPQAKVYTVRDYQRLGVGVYDEPFDFLLLPPALIKSLPTGWPAISVNIRSFQEMNWTSVVDYFVELQRAVTTGGVFCCINRFSKTIGGHEINYDRFPFDARWRTLRDGKVPFQAHIREAIFERA